MSNDMPETIRAVGANSGHLSYSWSTREIMEKNNSADTYFYPGSDYVREDLHAAMKSRLDKALVLISWLEVAVRKSKERFEAIDHESNDEAELLCKAGNDAYREFKEGDGK